MLPTDRITSLAGFIDAMKSVFTVYGGHVSPGGAVVLSGAGSVLGAVAAAAFIWVMLTNALTWIMGASRSQAVACLDGAGPRCLGDFSGRLGTPVRICLVAGAVATTTTIAAFAVSGGDGQRYFSVVLSLSIALLALSNLAVFPALVKLRYSHPDVPRPFRVPGGMVGAWLCSALATAWAAFALLAVLWPGLGMPNPDAALPDGFAGDRLGFLLAELVPLGRALAAAFASPASAAARSTRPKSPSGRRRPPARRLTRRDRPDRALAARARGEAGVRRAAHLRRRAVHAGPGRARAASTSPSSARRPTTSSPTGRATRFGPRAIRAASCPPGPHLEAKVDAFEELRIVDFGDAPVIPADPVRTHAAIEALVGQVLAAGAIPVVLGGDHSISEPDIRAVAGATARSALVHFDTHTDTGTEVYGVEVSHGTPFYRLVEQGHVDPRRYVQIGLRGYWPGEAEFAWQAEQGSRASSCTTCASWGSRRSSGGRRDRRRRPGLPHDRRGRARPGVRARDGHARAGRDDDGRPALGRPHARGRAGARRRRRRRGDPDRGRLGRHHGARRRPDRARDPHRDRARAAALNAGATSPPERAA